MSALVTDKAPVRERCHLSELTVFDAVRAPNSHHGHFAIHREPKVGRDSSPEVLQECKFKNDPFYTELDHSSPAIVPLSHCPDGATAILSGATACSLVR